MRFPGWTVGQGRKVGRMSKGTLRGVMPLTAELVDDLRKLLGQEKADRLIAAGKAGRPVFYAAEVGPDGVLREFGSSPSGQRPALRDGALVWPERGGSAWEVPMPRRAAAGLPATHQGGAPTPPLNGSSPRPLGTSDSSLPRSVLRRSSKGVK